MKLTSAEMDRYGPLYDFRPTFGPGITVISGPNEAGKTLYLEGLLQLLEPDIGDLMTPGPRVPEGPVGRVVVEHSGEQYECTGDTALSEFSAIDPAHLQSIFVVRDNDLQLPEGRDYYTSLIEKLGDIHTTEIAAVKSALKDRGRLTDSRLDVSSDQQYHGAGTVKASAEELAAEIREYVETIEAEGLETLEATRLRRSRELKTVEAALEEQTAAKTARTYAHLDQQLETFRRIVSERQSLADFTRDRLTELRELRDSIEQKQATRADVTANIEDARDTIERTGDTLDELRDRQRELEHRANTVETASEALRDYRNTQNQAVGTDQQIALTKPALLIGLLAGGAAGIVGAVAGRPLAIVLGIALLGISLVCALVLYRALRHQSAVVTAREQALWAARDAGFDVESVDDVAPAIESFENQREMLREKIVRAEHEHEAAREELEELEQEGATLDEAIDSAQAALAEQLETAGVESVAAFAEQVERREDLQPDLQAARQSLVDAFGDPAAGTPQENAATWEQALNEMAEEAAVSTVDPGEFDADELSRLETRREELVAELEALETKLESYDERLDAFATRAAALTTRPFIGTDVALEARTKAGLLELADDLDSVVVQIKADAELSRKALAVFEQIEDREEQKITDLFDPEGPASTSFDQLTDGRYTEVAYDADSHDLVVKGRDGGSYRPDVLSQGTRDQLYFATRVSLAKQLLGPDPGFLLLDDPFLAADPTRLRQGFEALTELARDGWQILYFTAKQEVSETMVAAFDLEHIDMGTRSIASAQSR